MSYLFLYGPLNPALLLLFIAIAVGYLRLYRFKAARVPASFWMALLLLAILFFSPLQILSAYYLFSAHMLVHVALLLVVGPLLVASLPQTAAWVQRLSQKLFQKPMPGWLAGVGIMWLWHLPPVFNAAMHGMHNGSGFGIITLLENASLLGAGMLFSWPLLAPQKRHRLHALNGVAYLFTACIACSLLGLLITFAPAGLYRHFLAAPDVYQWNNKLVQGWGFTQAADQQIAGLIMWVPCCLLYVSYALYLLARWFGQKEAGQKYALRDR